MDAFVLDPANTRDLAPEAIGPDGRLRVLPAAWWATTTPAERALFGNRHGLYGFPTEELVAFLGDLIGGRTAIEIGAGHGVLADALGIIGTDSLQQEKEPYRSFYLMSGHPIVPYGPNIIALDAATAVREYQPDVVIGSWVTHLYDPQRHFAGGNEVGIDEADVLAHCQTYVVIGNEKVHAGKAIWVRDHEVFYPDFVYSRAINGTRDFVAVWPGALAPAE